MAIKVTESKICDGLQIHVTRSTSTIYVESFMVYEKVHNIDNIGYAAMLCRQ